MRDRPISRWGLAAVFFAAICSNVANANPSGQPAPTAAKPAPQWIGFVTLGRPALHSPAGWTAEDERLGAAHFAYWQRQTAEGRAILVGRTLDKDDKGNLAPDALGMMIFQAADRASAEALMAADPGVKGGVFVARVSSYAVVLNRSSGEQKK